MMLGAPDMPVYTCSQYYCPSGRAHAMVVPNPRMFRHELDLIAMDVLASFLLIASFPRVGHGSQQFCSSVNLSSTNCS